MVMLGALLRRYVEGDKEGFRVSAAPMRSSSAFPAHCLRWGACGVIQMQPASGGRESTAMPACMQEAMTAEADSLARTSFGPTMLRAIGRCYVSQVPCSWPHPGSSFQAHSAETCMPEERSISMGLIGVSANSGGDPRGQLLRGLPGGHEVQGPQPEEPDARGRPRAQGASSLIHTCCSSCDSL